MAVLRVRGLGKVFGSGELVVTALDDVNLDVQAGELVALLGPSGSGKTTLLLCISLILDPSAGEIEMNGQAIFHNGRVQIDVRRFRRENVGFVFQAHNLIPFLSALDNVALAMQLNSVGKRASRERARELLDYLEIAHRADSLPATLSGGEQQRVAIARALANEPPLIFADEPTAALDTGRGMRVMELLKRVAREKRSAIVAVTHDVRMIAGFNTIYHMDDGRLSRTEAGAVATPSSVPVPNHKESLT
ncbi:MAG: ABC transporter ATP-binding protein [Chromatiaceae bacterium]|nr:ABC transporter ATP-binding protein [Thauera sp.]MBP6581999.1 ABC transporter ATP-binding protein [Chromatiaceae bacterium]MBP6733175.1 ABC transporter ATP-binding protein [Chromatiaceae bacterium]MBP8288238.1 ABC transporter ATP-binding protein [Chromatiaceae bacterium]MBP9756123.1 ABC transporter ATP-binding protein [Phenylobacterium sp.]